MQDENNPIFTDDYIAEGVYSSLQGNGMYTRYGVGIRGSLPYRMTDTFKAKPDMLKVYWYIYQYQPVFSFEYDVLEIPNGRLAHYLQELYQNHLVFRQRLDKYYISSKNPYVYRVNPEYVETVKAKFGEPMRFGDDAE